MPNNMAPIVRPLGQYYATSKNIPNNKLVANRHFDVSCIPATPDNRGNVSLTFDASDESMNVDGNESGIESNPSQIVESQSNKIYFVRSERVSELMLSSMSSLNNKQFMPKWISDTEIESIRQREMNPVLVVDSFEGPVFDRIKAIKGLRIFSPFAIIQCNPRDILSLPMRRHPVQNLCMKDYYVCCSNLNHASVLSVRSKVLTMGGRFSYHLRKRVNVLVTNNWFTKKSLVARSENGLIWVMQEEWIDRCWERSDKGCEIREPQQQKYRLPIFFGMQICASGFPQAEKAEIRKIVQDNGGIYSGSLIPNRTTHLIVSSPSGAKFEFAKNQSIHIVNREWLDCSVESGFPRLESDYTIIDGAMPTMTTSASAPLSNPINYSQNMPSSQDKISPPKRARLVAPNSSSSQPSQSEDIAARLNAVFNEVRDEGNLFEGFIFHILGYTEPVLAACKKLIKKVNCNVYTDLVAPVSHLVLGPKLTKKEAYDVSKFESRHGEKSKVCAEWIIDCIKSSSLVEPYLGPECEALFGACSTQDLSECERRCVYKKRTIEQSAELTKMIQAAKLMPSGQKESETANSDAPMGDKRPEKAKKGFRIGSMRDSPGKLLLKVCHEESAADTPTIPIYWDASQRLNISTRNDSRSKK